MSISSSALCLFGVKKRSTVLQEGAELSGSAIRGGHIHFWKVLLRGPERESDTDASVKGKRRRAAPCCAEPEVSKERLKLHPAVFFPRPSHGALKTRRETGDGRVKALPTRLRSLLRAIRGANLYQPGGIPTAADLSQDRYVGRRRIIADTSSVPYAELRRSSGQSDRDLGAHARRSRTAHFFLNEVDAFH